MEKLVKLLNEYEGDKIKNAEGLDVSKVWIMDGTLHYYDNYKDELVFDNIDLLIISARYRFIERLVDNHKLEPLEIEIGTCMEAEINGGKYRLYRDTYKDYDSLLMYLAIHDKPLEYLCSILKE